MPNPEKLSREAKLKFLRELSNNPQFLEGNQRAREDIAEGRTVSLEELEKEIQDRRREPK